MAKFKNLSLDLETGERIDFDDDDLITMGYDGSELYINSTVSGIRAAQPYHMVRYDQLTEASGIFDDRFVWRDGSKELTGHWNTGNTYGIETPYIKFDLAPSGIAHEEGELHWSEEDGTLELEMPGGNVRLQIGQENLLKVTNKTGETILNGSIVYVDGAQGGRPTISLARSDSFDTAKIIGMATEDINNNNSGYVTTNGLVRDIDTLGYSEGTLLYLSPTISGTFTDIKPIAPDWKACVGYVIRESVNEGEVLISTRLVPTMMYLSDVLEAVPSDGEYLVWNGANERFELTSFSGIDDIDHGSLLGLEDDDHPQYVPRDGSRGFTGTVSGIDPTEDYHLTTRFYIDDLVSTTSGNIVDQIVIDHGDLDGLVDDDHLQYVPRDGSRGFTNTVSGVAATESEHLVIYDQLLTASGTLQDQIDDAVVLISYAEDDTLTTTTSTTYQTKTSTSIPPTYSGTVRVAWSMEYNASANNKDVFVRAYNSTDAILLGENNQQTNNSANWWTFAGFAFVNVNDTSKTFVLQYRKGTADCSVRNAHLEVWKITNEFI